MWRPADPLEDSSREEEERYGRSRRRSPVRDRVDLSARRSLVADLPKARFLAVVWSSRERLRAARSAAEDGSSNPEPDREVNSKARSKACPAPVPPSSREAAAHFKVSAAAA